MSDAGTDILIVEDEPKLAQLMADFLRDAGYAPRWSGDGHEAHREIIAHMPDLIILDLMLPGKDGLEICRELRISSDVPIIMVTAQVEEVHRLLGLEIGADDYICKPFSLLELVARVKAILRRGRLQKNPETSPLQLFPEYYRATFYSESVELTPLEFRLLETLASSPGRVYSRDSLMDRLYKDHRFVVDRTIDSHVKKIRRKFSRISQTGDIIQSVYGAGYKLAL